MERLVLETTRQMSNNGIETRIYTAFANPRITTDQGGEVDIRTEDIPLSTIFQLYYSLPIALRLIDVASSWADIIILHSGVGLAEYAWRKHGVPCIPFFHVDDKYDPTLFGRFGGLSSLYTYPLRLQESKCIRSVPLAFANSRNLRNAVGSVRGGRVTVVPLGVNIDRFRPTWNDDEYILMVGRFNPTNNFELGLRTAVNTSCKIIISGIPEKKFLPYYRHLRDLVNGCRKLRNRVEFLTETDDSELVGLLQNCSVFLSPRKYDYLGLAALEAMACGKPLIAYNAEEDLEYSPVIKCGDHFSTWQETLETLMVDRQLRNKIGRASRQFIEERHTWKKTVDLMLSKIEDLRHAGSLGLSSRASGERKGK